MTCDHCNHSHMLHMMYVLDTGTGEVPVAEITLKGQSKSLSMSDRHRTYDFLLLIHSSDFFLRHINQWSVILHHHVTHVHMRAVKQLLNFEIALVTFQHTFSVLLHNAVFNCTLFFILHHVTTVTY